MKSFSHPLCAAGILLSSCYLVMGVAGGEPMNNRIAPVPQKKVKRVDARRNGGSEGEDKPTQYLCWKNGQQMRGKLESLTQEGDLGWYSDGFSRQLEFDSGKGVSRILLNRQARNLGRLTDVQVHLHDGQTFIFSGLTIDGDFVVGDRGEKGVLKIPMKQVSRVNSLPENILLAQRGVDSPKGWNNMALMEGEFTPSWYYKDKGFTSHSTGAMVWHQGKLETSFYLRMDVELANCEKDDFMLLLLPEAPEGTKPAGDKEIPPNEQRFYPDLQLIKYPQFMIIDFRMQYVNVQYCEVDKDGNLRIRNISPIDQRRYETRQTYGLSKHTYELFFDVGTKRIRILRDGELLAMTTPPRDDDKAQNYNEIGKTAMDKFFNNLSFALVSAPRQGYVRCSNIATGSELPREDKTADGDDKSQHRIILADGTRIRGAKVAHNGGKFHLEGGGGDLREFEMPAVVEWRLPELDVKVGAIHPLLELTNGEKMHVRGITRKGEDRYEVVSDFGIFSFPESNAAELIFAGSEKNPGETQAGEEQGTGGIFGDEFGDN